ncbi:MAG: flagellar motor switch protein FliG [Oscillospiraceae bacterium]|nr:flagellar motor switch protein FliG [Oscillospiraceae bacterium]MBQ8883035.1 flagellar motor switch protein FliG [Oscillospiraceae bacterium]
MAKKPQNKTAEDTTNKTEKADSGKILTGVSAADSSVKAAAVMIALGQESASEVFKYLHDDEIEKLSIEISKLEHMSSDEINDIINEFYEMCITQKAIIEGGQGYAKSVLVRAFGTQRAEYLIEKANKSGKTTNFAFVKDVDYKNLLMMIQNEHPQTIAIILSYANAEKASQIIAELPSEIQIDVIERISNLDRASPEIISIVDEILQSKLSSITSVDVLEYGGVSHIAEIMNRIDRRAEKNIFEGLKGTNPDLADQIKKLMFVFEDVVTLDDIEIQMFIREVDTKDLTIALKAATQEVTDKIFSNMSQRQRETIQSDMQYLHNLRMRDVEAAQQRIVDVIRRLEEQGDIIVYKGGDDEIIA